MTEIETKNVVVTGANRGIGLEIVKIYVARGATVYGVCRTTSDELDATGATVLAGVDVRSDGLAAQLGAALGDTRVDVAVLNAGVLAGDALGSIDYDTIRFQFEVNTLGPLRCTEALLKNLGDGSRVAIITSRMGSVADNTSGGMYGYRASKAAVNMVGRSLAHDLRSRGIAVQLLHPGFVRTGMTGGNGHVDPDVSARDLVARIDELSIASTGTFRHANGEPLPW